jgi:hypothetical protein
VRCIVRCRRVAELEAAEETRKAQAAAAGKLAEACAAEARRSVALEDEKIALVAGPRLTDPHCSAHTVPMADTLPTAHRSPLQCSYSAQIPTDGSSAHSAQCPLMAWRCACTAQVAAHAAALEHADARRLSELAAAEASRADALHKAKALKDIALGFKEARRVAELRRHTTEVRAHGTTVTQSARTSVHHPCTLLNVACALMCVLQVKAIRARELAPKIMAAERRFRAALGKLEEGHHGALEAREMQHKLAIAALQREARAREHAIATQLSQQQEKYRKLKLGGSWAGFGR